MRTLKLKTSLIKLTKSQRLYELDIPIIGLTGGIATGKSTVSKMFKDLGITVIDADNLIHDIYKEQNTINFIKTIAAPAINENTIDFKSLREIFFNNSSVKNDVVNFLYKELPRVFNEALSRFNNPQLVVYDVPMLFENKLETKLELTITVYSSRDIQLTRVIERDNIAIGLANKILDQQMDIEAKKDKADYILRNTGNLNDLHTEFQTLTSQLFI